MRVILCGSSFLTYEDVTAFRVKYTNGKYMGILFNSKEGIIHSNLPFVLVGVREEDMKNWEKN